jgi:hypothetical protein
MPDKWALLIIGIALLLAVGRGLLPSFGAKVTLALLVACYVGLGLLAFAAPFWFVLPYL